MKKLFYLFPLVMLATALPKAEAQSTPMIIPQPQQMEPGQGLFVITPVTPLVADPASLAGKALNRFLQQYYGFTLKPAAQAVNADGTITISRSGTATPVAGAYQLNCGAKGINILAADDEGLFYGVQTLLQMLPPATTKALKVNVPAVRINDAPRFAYRGMMLDVSRHFFSVNDIKKLLDQLAYFKINTFHWHLTEDQAWRIEIKKYPKLTEVGAWRDGTIIGRYPGTGNDNVRYGGFYTQEQVKEIVRYAAERHITVVPEIEMPGHSGAAIAAYPWLSCFPDEETIIPKHPSEAAKMKKGKKVMESWGVYEDVFAPTEETFQFLQDVIDEIVPLFPGKYIHVGGDECPKEAWKRSAFCQQLIKEKGLKDEHGLQSYFIQRMEKYINSKGKQIIGWDEILEGGLAPNATVMSWRGEEGGIEAARQKHDVIMSPTTHSYLDYSQTAYEDSVTIGGFIPLEKIYGYEPLPAPLGGTEFEAYVKGAQVNLWSEYLRNTAKMEYMLYPRLAAFSEVAWTKPENKSWQKFEERIPALFDKLRMMNTNFSRAYFEISAAIHATPARDGVLWQLGSKNPAAAISHQAPGGSEQAYTAPVAITTSGKWKAVIKEGSKVVQTIEQPFVLHKALGKKISLAQMPSAKYPGNGGVGGLVNGAASHKGLNSTEWCGWEGSDLEATIDLEKATPIANLKVHTIESAGSWIYHPASVEVWVSQNGEDYQAVSKQVLDSKPVDDDFRTIDLKWATTTARFVKVLVKNFGIIPTGLPGASNPAWLFVDEIEVH